MRLKSQRQLMLAAIAGLAVLAAGLTAALALQPEERSSVSLGKSSVSVEAMRPAALADDMVEEAPAASAQRELGGGEASFYGQELAGNPTASGERFDPNKLTAAHRTLPLGSRLRVTNPANGESVVVRVNDRGPYHGNRAIDLSYAAARQIGLISSGVGQVRMALLLD